MRSAIIFDLDGTLVDTAHDLTGALNAVLAKAGRDRVRLSQVRHTVGGGARGMVEWGFAETGDALAASDLDDWTAAFLRHYRAHLCDLSRPFAGVAETLAALAVENSAMGVCTNKSVEASRRLLRELGLERFFGAVLGGDSLAVRKPDPEHLLETVRRLGYEPAQAVMVGDTNVDMTTARAAGIPVVAVSFGYAHDGAKNLAADVLIDEFSQLPAALKRIS